MTNRLSSMLNKVIHPSQAAFLKGQIIQNHILLAFELMRGYSRKGGTPRWMMQLDLQKAYDMVDWTSLEGIHYEIGIPKKFIDWVMLGTTIVSYRFNVNGEFSDILHAKRGIRQGYSISPLLFVIMMEYMNRVMTKMKESSDFRYHSKCKKIGITHLAFADDVLLFSRGDQNSIETIIDAFNIFSESTGLVIYPKKCKAFYGGMDTDTIAQVHAKTNFEEGQLPIRYIGIPLTSKKLTINHYMPLVD